MQASNEGRWQARDLNKEASIKATKQARRFHESKKVARMQAAKKARKQASTLQECFQIRKEGGSVAKWKKVSKETRK